MSDNEHLVPGGLPRGKITTIFGESGNFNTTMDGVIVWDIVVQLPWYKRLWHWVTRRNETALVVTHVDPEEGIITVEEMLNER
jgi:hypothetical protein